MLKTLLVYAHLLASCLALGRVLHADHQLWSWRTRQLATAQLEYLAETRRLVGLALGALWLSGLLLVLQGYLSEGPAYLLNQKLWAKVAVVVLSLNGLVLHRVGFPRLLQAPFVALPFSSRSGLAMLGALSTSGWLFAAFLGVARQWNHALSCLQVMMVFATLLGLACVVGLTMAIAAGAQGRRAAC